jgi:hypothetical protein
LFKNFLLLPDLSHPPLRGLPSSLLVAQEKITLLVATWKGKLNIISPLIELKWVFS